MKALICRVHMPTGHIIEPVPLTEKRRGLSPGGRFPPSFIHKVNVLNLYGMQRKIIKIFN